MVTLPFRPPALNRWSARISLSPSGLPERSSQPSLSLQAIFKPTHQVLWASLITCPSKPFSNQHAKRCEPVLSFLNILPAPTSHFRTGTPSSVSQSRLFNQITCPSKPFWINMLSVVSQSRHSSSDYLPLQAISEPIHQALQASPIFFIRLPAPPIHFWTDTPCAVSQSRHSSLDSSFINGSSGIKQSFSASDNEYSDAFLTSCREIPISKAFYFVF